MRRRSLRRTGRPVRPMDWVGSSFICNSYSTLGPCEAQAVYVVPPSQVRDTFTDPTLMTSLLAIDFVTFTTDGFSRPGQFYFGLISWNDINDTVPLDFPDPFDNIEADWICVGALPFYSPVSGTVFGGTTSERGDGMVQYNAKRRLGNDKGILLSVVNDSPVTVLWKFAYRGLIKE